MVHSELHLINVSLPLVSDSSLYTVDIQDGRFTRILAQSEYTQALDFAPIDHLDHVHLAADIQKWDVKGRIMLPPFVDAHMHLDKAFCLPQIPNYSGTLREAVGSYHAASAHFTLEEMKGRMLRAALQAITYGTTTIRTHIDLLNHLTGESVFLGIQAALEVKELLKAHLAIQIVPMCPLGINDREIAMIEEAISMGVDALGGAPHLSSTAQQDISHIFELASKHRLGIDLHTDESDDPAMNTLASIIAKTDEYDYRGRVVVDHLCSLSAMDEEKAAGLIDQIVEHQIGVVTLPTSNFYLQGRNDRGIVRRGLTRVQALLTAGARVATASDNLHDPFHPFGRGDLLQVGLLTAYGAHLGSPADQLTILRMVTETPAHLMGLANYGIKEGNEAAFVLLNAFHIEEVLTMLPEVRYVYKGDRWLNVVKQRNLWGIQELEDLWETAKPNGVRIR